MDDAAKFGEPDASGLPPLLPPGLRDLLPPDAETEAAAVEAAMATFARHGYQRVKPPLLEFEDGLLAGAGAGVADQTFRLMDPDTRRMMGLRADITPQVARIAATRLGNAPRPLRLSYAGQCLRVQGSQLAPDRQVAQAGIELIGSDAPEADAEVILVAAEALGAAGVARFSFDLTLPALAPALLDAGGMAGGSRRALLHALDRKDAAAVATHGGALAGQLTRLLLAAGPVGPALDALRRERLPDAAEGLREALVATVRAIQARAPGLRLTLDPLEFRGFPYHTGLCTTVFAPRRHEELGRGGRYRCGGEPAVGFSLLPDAVLRAASPRAAVPRAYVPWGADRDAAARLRERGFATVAALAPGDAPAEARRLLCTHLLRDGEAVALEPES
jgi:ATP phosphoribosyltransferase regulatory subunit